MTPPRASLTDRSKLKSWLLPAGILLLFAGYFCHRLYGVYFPLDADVLPNLYYRMFQPLMWADHNPYRGYYSAYLPVMGLHNPVIQFFYFVLGKIFSLPQVSVAVWTNFLSGTFCLWMVSLSVCFFFIKIGFSRWASILAAVICSYTGFHLMGIRLFDQFYLLSFAAVCPTLYAFLRIDQDEDRFFWAAFAALVIGVSLLGGGNSPLFMFLPFFFVIPWIGRGAVRPLVVRLRTSLWLLGTTAVGCLTGAATLIPGIWHVGEMNRAHMVFEPKGLMEANLPLVSRFLPFFLRGWVPDLHVLSTQTDLYLGGVVLALVIQGCITSFPGANEQHPRKINKIRNSAEVLEKLLRIILVVGFVILLFDYLPYWMQKPIEYFFLHLSLRFPNRFITLLLLPLAYYAARGFDSLEKRSFSFVGVSTFLFTGFLILVCLVPAWSKGAPEFHAPAAVSLGAGLVALLLLMMRKPATSVVSVCLIYLMFAFAPLPWSSLEFWVNQSGEAMRAEWPADRNTWQSFLGFRWRYNETVARVSRVFFEVPPNFRNPATLAGRILSPSRGKFRELNFFSGVTNHQFAFTELADPATPKRISEIGTDASAAVLDLANVCWQTPEADVRGDGSLENLPLMSRPSCFPQAFVVAGAVPVSNDDEAVRWVRNAGRGDLLRAIAVTCQGPECAKLPAPAENLYEPIRVITARPGFFDFEVETKRPGFLFLSVPYRRDWAARINGKPEKVWRANAAYMAVPIRAGKSRVSLELGHQVQHAAEALSGLLILILGLSMPLYVSSKNGRLKKLLPGKAT
jgi:hypothetical protein